MSPARARHGRRQTAGFTLIELMVVVVIIGILIGLVVTVIPKVRRAVYGAQTQAQLSALSNAIQQYYNDFKAYPGPLANNQLGEAYYGNTPFPNQYAGGLALQGSSPFPSPNTGNVTTLDYAHISGTQNLTLGLLGGLEFNNTTAPATFVYNPQAIFSDGVTPAPRGPATLNPNTPRRQQPYIQVKTGDLSVPSSNYNMGAGASFADSAQRSPNDAMIPVFMDKYAEPLPILYFRTNIGGQAVVGIGLDDDNGVQLKDSQAPNAALSSVAYDLCQVLQYTRSQIGTGATPNDHHGLSGIGNLATDTIASGWANAGRNGAAYLRDPNFRIDTTNSANSYDPNASNTHDGVARQKDGYLLISAGPDRLYGTSDDLVNPGPLLPAQ